MSEHLRPFLALALVVVVLGVIIFAPSQTGALLWQGGGGGGSWDTTKPTASISASPASPTPTQSVTFSASASDNSRVNYIYIYVDGGLKRTCSINAASGSCSYSQTLTAGSHSYYAIAKDSSNNQGNSGTKYVTSTAPSTTTVSITKSDSAVNAWAPLKNDVTLDFGQDYTGVSKIDFKGIPGGELCGAAVKIEVSYSGGSVTSASTGRVDAHQTASSSVSIPYGSKVAKVKGYLVDDGNIGTNDCQHIDLLEATLVISDDKNGPTISSKVNSEKEEIASSAGYGASQLVKVVFDVAASDPSKVSSIAVKIGNVEKKKCTFSTPSTTADCQYVMIKDEIVNYANSNTAQTVTIEATDALGNTNIYTDTIKLNRFGFCLGSGC